MATIVVNGAQGGLLKCSRLIVDAPLMNHYSESKQAPRGQRSTFNRRHEPTTLYRSSEPTWNELSETVANAQHKWEMLLAYKSPMDVFYTLREVYPVVYSWKKAIVHFYKKHRLGILKTPTYTPIHSAHKRKNNLWSARGGEKKQVRRCRLFMRLMWPARLS